VNIFMHLPVLATYLQALLIDPIPICILSILPYTGMTSKKSFGEYLMVLNHTLTVHRVIFFAVNAFCLKHHLASVVSCNLLTSHVESNPDLHTLNSLLQG